MSGGTPDIGVRFAPALWPSPEILCSPTLRSGPRRVHRRAEGTASCGAQNIRKDILMSTNTKPTHRIFAVSQREGRKADWFELGAAWQHQDGQGFNLKLKAPLPPGAELVMRTAKAKRTAQAQSA